MGFGRFSRAMLLVGAVALFAVPASAATGIAYDEVSFGTTARPLPQVGDFETVWASHLADIKAHADVPKRERARLYGIVLSFAILGDMERTDDLATGTTTIFRPGDHQVVHLDNVRQTYYVTTSNAPSQLYTIRSGVAPQAPDPDATAVSATLQSTLNPLPNVTIGGVTYTGANGRVLQTVDDKRCAHVQALGTFVMYVDPTRREPIRTGSFYAMPLADAGEPLSRISGCNVSAAANVLSAIPGYPNFLLYSLTMEIVAKSDGALQPMPPGVTANVLMRGHVRALTDADASLFIAPKNYKRVAAPTPVQSPGTT
jgi:hypothetical protein